MAVENRRLTESIKLLFDGFVCRYKDLADGQRLLVTERPGRLRIVAGGGLSAPPERLWDPSPYYSLAAGT